MSKAICFVANYSKTVFFERIAEELRGGGFDIFWISVNKIISRSLASRWGGGNVLYISRSQEYENPVSDFKINEIIQSDRSLRVQQEWARKYLESIQRPILDFIEKNKIRFVLGEVTWGHEILMHRITREFKNLNCTFLNPHTVRIPKSHFGFFLDEKQSELVEMGYANEFRSFNLVPEKPDYLRLNDNIIKKHFSISGRVKRLFNFVGRSNYDEGDPTIVHSRMKNLIIKSKTELNRELYRFVKKYKSCEIKGRKYILYLLHKQPEASIDVLGRYYDNQYINILNVWRSLPQGVALFVKEHSNAVGDRSFFFYRALKKLSDTYLIDENEETYGLISSAEAVVTVSGTGAYEAALLGVRSYTYAPTFFNKIDMCRRISLELMQGSSSIYSDNFKYQDNTREFARWLSRRIFNGIISDPVSNPGCMSKENIKNVSNAIVEVARYLEMKNAK